MVSWQRFQHKFRIKKNSACVQFGEKFRHNKLLQIKPTNTLYLTTNENMLPTQAKNRKFFNEK